MAGSGAAADRQIRRHGRGDPHLQVLPLPVAPRRAAAVRIDDRQQSAWRRGNRALPDLAGAELRASRHHSGAGAALGPAQAHVRPALPVGNRLLAAGLRAGAAHRGGQAPAGDRQPADRGDRAGGRLQRPGVVPPVVPPAGRHVARRLPQEAAAAGFRPADGNTRRGYCCAKRNCVSLPIGLARPQHHGGEVRAVDRIREPLRLQAQAAIGQVGLVLVRLVRRREADALVELQSRLGGRQLHRQVAAGRHQARRERQSACRPRQPALVQHEIDVVARPMLGADRTQDAEVIDGVDHAADLSGRDQEPVERRVEIRRHHHAMVAHVAARLQREIRMVAEVGDGRRIGGRGQLDAERAGARDRIGAARGQRAGIAGVAVGRGDLQRHRIVGRADQPPHPLGIPVRSAMEMHMVAFVDRHLVALAVEREAGVDPVDAAPDRRAEIGAAVDIALQRAIAQHHAPLRRSHRHHEVAQDRAVGDDRGLRAAAAPQLDFLHALVAETAEFRDRHGDLIRCFPLFKPVPRLDLKPAPRH